MRTQYCIRLPYIHPMKAMGGHALALCLRAHQGGPIFERPLKFGPGLVVGLEQASICMPLLRVKIAPGEPVCADDKRHVVKLREDFCGLACPFLLGRHGLWKRPVEMRRIVVQPRIAGRHRPFSDNNRLARFFVDQGQVFTLSGIQLPCVVRRIDVYGNSVETAT